MKNSEFLLSDKMMQYNESNLQNDDNNKITRISPMICKLTQAPNGNQCAEYSLNSYPLHCLVKTDLLTHTQHKFKPPRSQSKQKSSGVFNYRTILLRVSFWVRG